MIVASFNLNAFNRMASSSIVKHYDTCEVMDEHFSMKVTMIDILMLFKDL